MLHLEPKSVGDMRPKIKVRGYMVNFRPFFARSSRNRPLYTPTVFRHADTLWRQTLNYGSQNGAHSDKSGPRFVIRN